MSEPEKQNFYNHFSSTDEAEAFIDSVISQFDKNDIWLPGYVQKVIQGLELGPHETEGYYRWLSVQIEKQGK